jgi:transcriptional regulator with PAS, ATPase and Fis domain
LFLDEIAELPMTLQVKLLRVLQEQEVLALGDSKPHKVDVRVLAATHQDVLQLVQQGRFRQDLYARLAGFSFTVLPLRQRLEDLGAIISTLIKKLAGEQAGKVTVQRGAARALFAYDWPLNIRELEQVLATSLALSSDNVIMLEHLPERIRTPTGTTAETTLSDEDQELKQRLVALLQQHRGNISAVAREMAKARVQIRRWCKRYAIDVAQYQR